MRDSWLEEATWTCDRGVHQIQPVQCVLIVSRTALHPTFIALITGGSPSLLFYRGPKMLRPGGGLL